MITNFKIFENSDYFQNGDFIIRAMDNSLYYIFNIKNNAFLKIGHYNYKEIKWGVEDIEFLKQISLRKLYDDDINSELDKVLMTIPDDIIKEIDILTNGILYKQIENYRLDKNLKKFNI